MQQIKFEKTPMAENFWQYCAEIAAQISTNGDDIVRQNMGIVEKFYGRCISSGIAADSLVNIRAQVSILCGFRVV